MLVEKIINILHIKSEFLQLLIGAVVIALIISLGMFYLLDLAHFSITPALPAATGAIGAAIFAARFRRGK